MCNNRSSKRKTKIFWTAEFQILSDWGDLEKITASPAAMADHAISYHQYVYIYNYIYIVYIVVFMYMYVYIYIHIMCNYI